MLPVVLIVVVAMFFASYLQPESTGKFHNEIKSLYNEDNAPITRQPNANFQGRNLPPGHPDVSGEEVHVCATPSWFTPFINGKRYDTIIKDCPKFPTEATCEIITGQGKHKGPYPCIWYGSKN